MLAKASIQGLIAFRIPACAGMTKRGAVTIQMRLIRASAALRQSALEPAGPSLKSRSYDNLLTKTEIRATFIPSTASNPNLACRAGGLRGSNERWKPLETFRTRGSKFFI
jgi:hypothetical protein